MLNYILLGIIQGLTEFFPVSSSAHLVFAQKILALQNHVLATTVVLHLGTCLALIVFFFRDILENIFNPKLIAFIIVVTVITGAIGLSFKGLFERIFSAVTPAALALLVTGATLLITKGIRKAEREKVNIIDGIILGFVQAIAIIPGISRSGSTICALLFRKINRDVAFKMSFLASIPAVLGAALLEFKDVYVSMKADFSCLVAGFVFSFIFGLIALRILKSAMHRAKLYYFGYYCIIMGLICLIFLRN